MRRTGSLLASFFLLIMVTTTIGVLADYVNMIIERVMSTRQHIVMARLATDS